MQRGFSVIFIIIGVVVLLGVVGGVFYLGRITAPKSSVSSPSPTVITSSTQNSSYPVATPNASPNPVEISLVPIGQYTISFTRANGTVYLRYKNKISSPDDGTQTVVEKPTLTNPDSYTWYGLMDAPANTDHQGFDEIISFRVLPNKTNFLFTTQFTIGTGANATSVFDLYYYDPSKQNKLTKLYAGSYQNLIPLIYQVSADSKYASFNMLPCYSCDGLPKEMMLINLETGASKRINGWIGLFNWKNNGAYEYKINKEITCVEPAMFCLEKLENLPLQTGQF